MIQYALLICYLYSINTTIYKGNSWITGGGGQSFKKLFLITMNYTQKYDLFFPFFIKVVVNKSKAAYSFLIIGMMHLQKILLSVIMLRFHFFTSKQGTSVHKDDRGPFVVALQSGHTVWFLFFFAEFLLYVVCGFLAKQIL